MGYSPYYTAGIWGGCDNNQKLKDEHGSRNGGTSFAKRIWRKIMTRVHDGMSDPGFPMPDGIETAQVCRKSGKLAVPGVCSSDPRGNASLHRIFCQRPPHRAEACDHHVRVTVCAVSGGRPTAFCPPDQQEARTFMALPAMKALRTIPTMQCRITVRCITAPPQLLIRLRRTEAISHLVPVIYRKQRLLILSHMNTTLIPGLPETVTQFR